MSLLQATTSWHVLVDALHPCIEIFVLLNSCKVCLAMKADKVRHEYCLPLLLTKPSIFEPEVSLFPV